MAKPLVVALIGTGWAGSMHAASYKQISGVDFRLKWVCSLEASLPEFAAQYGFERCTADLNEVLTDPEVTVIDLVTPPSSHLDMILAALKAGKHVVCEKPVTGCFRSPEEIKPEQMLAEVDKQLAQLEQTLKAGGSTFCYAENWIYSPPFQRMAELLLQKGSRCFEIEGFTGHKGSHAAHSLWWKFNGGGALIRQGTHPVSAALYLKRRELEARGEPFRVDTVFCSTARFPRGAAIPEGDTENWGQVILTFSDGTRSCITAGDVFMGQIYNQMRVFASDAVFQCNMTPNNLLQVYLPNDTGVADAHIMEKNDGNVGWQNALVLEEQLRGYVGELQDFLCAIRDQRQPLSDFALAADTLRVIYAAYLSAQEHREIRLTGDGLHS